MWTQELLEDYRTLRRLRSRHAVDGQPRRSNVDAGVVGGLSDFGPIYCDVIGPSKQEFLLCLGAGSRTYQLHCPIITPLGIEVPIAHITQRL